MTRACLIAAMTSLGASLLLGGGTRPGYLSDAILQVVCLLPLLLAVYGLADGPWRGRLRGGHLRLALIIGSGIVLLPLLQLIPLPPTMWTRLPGRQTIVESYQLLGRDLPWWPLSISPQTTWTSVVALVPPMAVFLATSQLHHPGRRRVGLMLVALGCLGAVAGLLQAAQGSTGPLRFYPPFTDSDAVGFFANRNHFGASLNCAALLLIAWLGPLVARALDDMQRGQPGARSIGWLAGGLLGLIVLVAAQAASHSRAGLILMAGGLLAGLVLTRPAMKTERAKTTSIVLGWGIVLAIVFSVQGALVRAVARLETDPMSDARLVYARNTVKAIAAYFPFGSGTGSFVPIYPLFEPIKDLFEGIYANRAHNDFLEVLLETGAPGLLLGLLFLCWLIARARVVWSAPSDAGDELDQGLSKAAVLIILLVLAHSVVDYPLRTGGMAAVFAVACALLMPLPTSASREASRARRAARSSKAAAKQDRRLPDIPVPVTAQAAAGWQPVSPTALEDWRPPPAPLSGSPVPQQTGVSTTPANTQPRSAPAAWEPVGGWPDAWQPASAKATAAPRPPDRSSKPDGQTQN
jgi:O-antigen ligase